MVQKLLLAFCLVTISVLISCTDAAPPADKTSSGSSSTAAPAGPVSGKTAFWELYKSAHSWAADLQPLKLESKSIPGMKNDAGKAAMWSATFGSLGKHEARVFTYAVASHAPDIYKGVTVGQPLPWNGPSPDAQTFASVDFAVDSDAAYKTAMGDAAAWVDKHPDKDFSLALCSAARFKAPVWYVWWGDNKSGYAVFVDARDGNVVKPKK